MAGAFRVFNEEIFCTKSHTKVAESAASYGHIDGELGVAESGEKGTEAGNGVGENDGWTGVVGGRACCDEHGGADHAAEA